MSWVLAFVGFALLIVLHEFGHFIAAKAVGMRVERFALFFPPLIARYRRRGSETEYGLGAIPLGGYVKISGMNPAEELPPEVQPRAYYRQPVWKRIVVIAAGPAMNVLIAFLILLGLYLTNTYETTNTVSAERLAPPAASVLQPGDRITAVDGRRGDFEAIRAQINTHACAGGAKRDGCVAAEPAQVTVVRDGRTLTFELAPRYSVENERMLLGFAPEREQVSVGFFTAAGRSVETMWEVTTRTVSAIVRVVTPEGREQINGVVGGYETTRQAFNLDATQALFILALISLSLAIVNLFPFLPLDGGHIFWALAEKVRGRAIPFAVMERAGVVGFLLVIFLFFIGLSNDIERLNGEGFGLR